MTSHEEAVLKTNEALWNAMFAYLEAVGDEAGTDDVEELWKIVRRSNVGSIINKAIIRSWLNEAIIKLLKAKAQGQ